MITTILVVAIVLWLLVAIAPLNNGAPYIGAGPGIRAIVTVLLAALLLYALFGRSFHLYD